MTKLKWKNHVHEYFGTQIYAFCDAQHNVVHIFVTVMTADDDRRGNGSQC